MTSLKFTPSLLLLFASIALCGSKSLYARSTLAQQAVELSWAQIASQKESLAVLWPKVRLGAVGGPKSVSLSDVCVEQRGIRLFRGVYPEVPTPEYAAVFCEESTEVCHHDRNKFSEGTKIESRILMLGMRFADQDILNQEVLVHSLVDGSVAGKQYSVPVCAQ